MNIAEEKIKHFFDCIEKEFADTDIHAEEIEESIALLDGSKNRSQELSLKLEKERTEKKRPCINIKSCLRIIKKRLKKFAHLVRKRKENNPQSVSVIIPTYSPNDFIYKAVDSALNQKNIQKVEVIISVNGPNISWYEELKRKYDQREEVKVLYCEQQGQSIARNRALLKANEDLIYYLDDDDYITENLFSEMLNVMNSEIVFVCAPYYDSDKGFNNYLIESYKKHPINKPRKLRRSDTWTCTTVTNKLFRKSFLLRCSPFDENTKVSEDLVFWADNFDKINGKVVHIKLEKEQYYYRLVREESLSRTQDKIKYIQDRLLILEEMERRLFLESYSWSAKQLIVRIIGAQHNLMERYFNMCNEAEKKIAREIINGYSGFYCNKGTFSEQNAIAFCHNFSPYIDASSMVATKRIKEIDHLSGETHKWTVIYKNMADIRNVDFVFEDFYAKNIYSKKIGIGGKTHTTPEGQIAFAVRAFDRSKDIDAKVIYSRAMFPGSHIAAYLYKKMHPDTVWYAEFSDPLQKDTEDNFRQEQFETETKYKDFFEVSEIVPYLYADHIIFTNEIQRDYMLSYNQYPEYNDSIIKKSIVMQHPQIKKQFVNLKNVSYKLDKDKINIGFFGTFYKNRSFEDIIMLADNPKVTLHFFSANKKMLKDLSAKNIKVSYALPYFEYLNIASKMDYIVMNDMDSPFGIIPWLPSKFSDYISTGTKIIAFCIEGSPLSKIEHKNLIKVYSCDKDFVMKVKKQGIDDV